MTHKVHGHSPRGIGKTNDWHFEVNAAEKHLRFQTVKFLFFILLSNLACHYFIFWQTSFFCRGLTQFSLCFTLSSKIFFLSIFLSHFATQASYRWIFLDESWSDQAPSQWCVKYLCMSLPVEWATHEGQRTLISPQDNGDVLFWVFFPWGELHNPCTWICNSVFTDNWIRAGHVSSLVSDLATVLAVSQACA